MFCKYCENVTNDTDVYCSKCGKSQIEKNETVASEKTTKIEKIARVINVLFFVFTYLVSLVIFIYIAVEDGGISPAVISAIIIFVITLLLNILIFRKKNIFVIKNKFKANKKLFSSVVSIIYIVLPLVLFFGSFEYSYYVTIGNS